MSPETVKVLGMRVGDARPLTRDSLSRFELDVYDDVAVQCEVNEDFLEVEFIFTVKGKEWHWHGGLIERRK